MQVRKQRALQFKIPAIDTKSVTNLKCDTLVWCVAYADPASVADLMKIGTGTVSVLTDNSKIPGTDIAGQKQLVIVGQWYLSIKYRSVYEQDED
ncbi:MAG: hypothetical protein LC662_09180 [Rhodothermaceae bacterium]|nr:hypothetical protein [Rhodothermaceae bacterium]